MIAILLTIEVHKERWFKLERHCDKEQKGSYQEKLLVAPPPPHERMKVSSRMTFGKAATRLLSLSLWLQIHTLIEAQALT